MFEDSSDGDDSEQDVHLAKYRKKFQNRQESDDEVEVLGVRSESDSDTDDQSDIALSDVEGQGDDDDDNDLPDPRAWGKETRKYYGTDYVDQDYGGFQSKDAAAAEAEQEEAKKLQQQLMEQLDVGLLDIESMFKKSEEAVKDTPQESIKTDFSMLTREEKLLKLQKESPEFFVLTEDFKAKLILARDFLCPIRQKVKAGTLEPCRAVDFVQTYYTLILNYAINIYMYLLLKISNKLKNHPIFQRLYQYRQMLSQLEPIFEEVIKPQISLILEQDSQEEAALKSKKKKTLKLLAQLQQRPPSEKPEKKVDESAGNLEEDKEIGAQEPEEQEPGVEKRGITYQIAKNKGLTPYRKKELRNPRVKHKIKFRKALIRRKGAVREPRKELSRYGGEMSGIKASVTKSIKIKS